MLFRSNRSTAVTTFRLFPVLPILVFSFRTAMDNHDCSWAFPASSSRNGLHKNGPKSYIRALASWTIAALSASFASESSVSNISNFARNCVSSSLAGSRSDKDCNESSIPSSDIFLSSRLSSPFGVKSVDGEISPPSESSRFFTSLDCWPLLGVRPSNFNLASVCTCCIVSIDLSNIISSIRPILNKTLPHASSGVFPQTASTGLPFNSISSTSPSRPISFSVPEN